MKFLHNEQFYRDFERIFLKGDFQGNLARALTSYKFSFESISNLIPTFFCGPIKRLLLCFLCVLQYLDLNMYYITYVFPIPQSFFISAIQGTLKLLSARDIPVISRMCIFPMQITRL